MRKLLALKQSFIDNDPKVIGFRGSIKQQEATASYMRELGLNHIACSINKQIIDTIEALDNYISSNFGF